MILAKKKRRQMTQRKRRPGSKASVGGNISLRDVIDSYPLSQGVHAPLLRSGKSNHSRAAEISR